MRTRARTITLRDGRTALLRPPEIRDAQALVDNLRQMSGETPFLLRTAEECTMTVSGEEAFIRRLLDSPLDVMLVCEAEGRVIGSCSLSRQPFRKTCHRAEVALALLKAWWGLGIGRAMLSAMEEEARAMGVARWSWNTSRVTTGLARCTKGTASARRVNIPMPSAWRTAVCAPST